MPIWKHGRSPANIVGERRGLKSAGGEAPKMCGPSRNGALQNSGDVLKTVTSSYQPIHGETALGTSAQGLADERLQ